MKSVARTKAAAGLMVTWLSIGAVGVATQAPLNKPPIASPDVFEGCRADPL